MPIPRRPGAGSRGLPLWLSGCCLLALLFSAESEARRSNKSSRPGSDERAPHAARGSGTTPREERDGLSALQAGKLTDAARLLALAYRSAPSPRGLFLLGRVAVAEGRDLDAHDLFRRFLADPDLERESDRETPASTSPPVAPPAPSAAAAPPAAAPPVVAPPVAAPAITASAAPAASSPPPAAPAPESEDAAAIREAEAYLTKPRPPAGTLNILGERGTLISVDGRVVGVLPLALPLLVSPSEHSVVLERGRDRIEDQVQIAAGRLGELRSDVSSRALLLSILPGILVAADFASLAPELRSRLLQSLEQALLSRRRSPLSSELALTLVPAQAGRLSGCLKDAGCQIELGKQVDAEAVLTVAGELKDGKLRLRVGLLDTVVGEEAAGEEPLCERCSPEQAGNLLRGVVGRVYEVGSTRGRAELSIRCDPEDGELSVDGRLIAGCRYGKPVFAGLHRLRLSLAGAPPSEREIRLAEGEKRDELLRVSIPEPPPAALVVPPPPPPPPRRPTWRLAVGGAALAGGLILSGFGIGMLSVNGSCVVGTTLPGEECERLFSTAVPGGVLLGGGLLLVAGGTLLIALPPSRRK